MQLSRRGNTPTFSLEANSALTRLDVDFGRWCGAPTRETSDIHC